MQTIEVETIFCFNFYRQVAKGRLKISGDGLNIIYHFLFQTTLLLTGIAFCRRTV